jgi:ABC-type Fe3+/spermidine/putrescine transport system ATPase subunit
MTMSDRVAVFRDGRIEQIGSPLAVYDRPANRFVAEFIGDSNFFAGRADPARPGVIELDGIGAVRVAAAASASGAVDVMIRPERLRLAPPAAADNTFDMLVDDAINYGDSILVIGTTQDLPLRARLVGHSPDTLQRGATLRLAWSPADARVLARG